MNLDTLRRVVPSLPTSNLLCLISEAAPPQLAILRGEFGYPACDCETGFLPCGCEGDCDCPAVPVPCEHTAERDWTWPVEAELLALLLSDREAYVEPPLPGVASEVLLREAMAVVMEERLEHGEGLRHPADWIRRPGEFDRLARPVSRRRNGSDSPGEIRLMSDDEDDAKAADRRAVAVELEAWRERQDPEQLASWREQLRGWRRRGEDRDLARAA